MRYGGMLGFSAVGASMLASCSPITQLGGAAKPPAHVPPASAKYLAVLIIDACRADYLNYADLPNIRSLIQRGTYYPHAWSGQLEAITPASHASLGTGFFPKHDGGVLGFWWENPDTHASFECANLTGNTHPGHPGNGHAIDPTVIETIIKDSKGPTLAGMLKDHDPSAKVYTASGNKFYAADAMGGPDADYISYFWNDGKKLYRPVSMPGHELPADIINDPAFRAYDYGHMIYGSPAPIHPGQQDAMVVDLATKVIERERPRIVMLNLPEMDWPVAHLDGGPRDSSSRAKVTHIMENADRQLGKLFDTYRNLGIFDQTIFAVIGDHGCLPLQWEVDRTPAEDAVSKAGTTLITGDFHTGGFMWIADPGLAMKVAALIDQAKMQGVKAVYYRDTVNGRPQYLPSPATAANVAADLDRSYRYLLETMNGRNAPHVVLLYPERVGTWKAGGNHPWLGDHGGASWGSQTLATVMAGPGIRQGYQSVYPSRLVDLTPTFLRLLGAPYPKLDGIALADSFKSPIKDEVGMQRRVANRLIPVTSTLRRESALDITKLPGNLANPAKGSHVQLSAASTSGPPPPQPHY